MKQDSKFLLNEQSIKFKAFFNETTISNSEKEICVIKGISLIPVSASVEPMTIKENFVRKSNEANSTITTDLYEGEYYLNVVDYTLGEISSAANFNCQKWSEKILPLFLADPKKDEMTITLKDDAIKERILEANPDYFQSTDDIDEFCKKYDITVNSLIQSASFSQLELQFATISARLSSEIFFFRTKLFTELFIQKLDQAIYNFEKNQNNEWLEFNKTLYHDWKKKELDKVEFYQKYIRSPYIFEDSEQYDNFQSPVKFNPKKSLPQELISETFYWIYRFPKAKDRFKRAVELYKTNGDKVDCLNNLRLSLELLIKAILGNDKSLENQLGSIGEYQKSLGIGGEIRNTFVKTIDYFTKYQNNNVKHDINIKSDHEVEFIFGLTMVFIRMLIKPNNDLNIDVV